MEIKPNPQVQQLVNQAAAELTSSDKSAAANTAMRSEQDLSSLLSNELADAVSGLKPNERADFDAGVKQALKSVFEGLASLSSGPRHLSKGQIDFDAAPVGMPNPKKALRITINFTAQGPDDLVYPDKYFQDPKTGKQLSAKEIKIGETGEMVTVKPGDAILDGWSGNPFSGKGIVAWNEADRMPIPIPADGSPTQMLLNGVDGSKLEKVVEIFGGRDPATLDGNELKAAFTRIANEVTGDIYKGGTADYAKNNLDPVNTDTPGIGLHSKPNLLTSAVKVSGPVEFNSPDAGDAVQSFPDGAVIIRTTVKNDDGTTKVVERGIKPEAFDGDGYQTVDGKPMTFDTLPEARVAGG